MELHHCADLYVNNCFLRCVLSSVLCNHCANRIATVRCRNNTMYPPKCINDSKCNFNYIYHVVSVICNHDSSPLIDDHVKIIIIML